MGVVVGEAFEVVVEGVQARGREDADLTHPPAHPLAPHPRLGDRVAVADHERADRCAEALGQAHGQYVGDRAVLRSGVPVATWAFQIRAPSRCTRAPAAVANSRRSRRSASGSTAPPAKLWVFSTEIAAVGTKNGPMSGANKDRIVSRSTWPRGSIQVRMVMPENAPWAPSSALAMWARDSQSTSWPGATRERTASTLAIDPVGVNSAASCPNVSATRSSSALTVGSSP